MLEGLVKSSVANAEGGEDVATMIGRGLFDVVILKIDELFVLNCPFGVLTMEKHIIGFDFFLLLTVLYQDRATWFRYSPIRKDRLKLPTVAIALTLLRKISSPKLFCLRTFIKQ